MSEQLVEVKPSELRVGDTIHVSFSSGEGFTQRLYLNERVEKVNTAYGQTVSEEGRGFAHEFSRFYLVGRSQTLPTAIGSAVKHTDGWKFIRLGANNWKGIDVDGSISIYDWSDEEIATSEWEEL